MRVDVKDLKYTAFISYARDDKAWAYDFISQLKRVTHDVWSDGNIPGGEKWWKEILKQIRENSEFICLLSMSAVKSINCREELKYAIALNKPIVPIWVHQNEDEQQRANEKIRYLGDLWGEINDTNVTDIVVEKYNSDSIEALHYAMEIGQYICGQAIKVSTGEIQINPNIIEPDTPRYRTEEDFENALERAEELYIKGELSRAREICEQINVDSEGKYEHHTVELLHNVDERIVYREIEDKINQDKTITAKRALEGYQQRFGKTKRAEELRKLIDSKSASLSRLDISLTSPNINFEDDEDA